MSLTSDQLTEKLAASQAENKRLKSRLEVTSESLALARSARAPKKIHTAKQKVRTTGDIVRVLVPDSHGSGIDTVVAAAFLADMKELNPHEVINLGDHVDCGGFLAQHHVMGYVAQTSYSYEEDILAANHFLDREQECAPNATFEYLEGNHEFRTERWAVTQALANSKDAEMLRRMVSPEFLLNTKKRGFNYRRQSEKYDGLSVPGTIKRGKCYFTHGFSTSKHAAAAHVARVGGNIVFAHTHRADVFVTSLVHVGTVAGYNPGCLCLKQPMYLHTNPTSWTHGYAIQLVDKKSGNFLHLNIPIVDGVSLLKPLLNHGIKAGH